MTELTLAERLATDLDGTFEALVGERQGPVYRFALRYCGNPQDGDRPGRVRAGISGDAGVRGGTDCGPPSDAVAADDHGEYWRAIACAESTSRPVDLDGVDELLSTELEEPGRVSERRELGDRLAAGTTAAAAALSGAGDSAPCAGFGYEEIAETLDQPPGTANRMSIAACMCSGSD